MFPVLVGIGLGLFGCAAVPSPGSSYVEGTVSATDSAVIAEAITSFVVAHLPPASSTLAIAPATVADPDGATASLPAAVSGDLRKAGYGVASGTLGGGDGYPVRYLITPLGHAMLLRVAAGHAAGSQMYAHDARGVLVATSPMTETDVTR